CNDSKDIYYLGKLVEDEDKKTLKFEYVDGLTDELKEFSRMDSLLNREDLKKNIFDFLNIIDGRNRRMISSDLGNRLFLEKKINLEFNKELQDNVITKVCYICKYKPKPLVRYKTK
ncbi:MAG: hypothetical protein K2M23_02265, partial [Alphaproteobacteria bacterium]|nr:hypothetical protein [Alphaproteobacteria bacterium]